MTQWFADTVETFSQLVTDGVLGELKLWPASLSFFVLITAFFWFFAIRRDERFSIKAVLGYGFPRDYYGDPTARVSHWHYALQVLLWGLCSLSLY